LNEWPVEEPKGYAVFTCAKVHRLLGWQARHDAGWWSAWVRSGPASAILQ